MANPTIAELMNAIRNNENILMEGPHGVGKTYTAKKAAEKLGYNVMTFDAGLMDAYVDLLGIPQVIEDEKGNKTLKEVRKEDIDNVEIIIYDEFNRAGKATLNGIMGLVQFHSVNGVPLPKLKSVISTMNPADDPRYSGTVQLDSAIRDRFHREYILEAEYSKTYLTKALGDKDVAGALVDWVSTISKDNGYIAPRRLEMLGQNFMTHKSKKDLFAAIPKDGKYSPNDLWTRLNNTNEKAMPKASKIDDMVTTRAGVVKNSDYLAKEINSGRISDAQFSTLKNTYAVMMGKASYERTKNVLDAMKSHWEGKNGGTFRIKVDQAKYYNIDYELTKYFAAK